MIYDKDGLAVAEVYLYDGSKNDTAYDYSGNAIQIKKKTLNDLKWVCVGDSLTDPSINNPNKYHKVIHSFFPGMKLTVLGKGSTGYWRGGDKNSCFYQRMSGNIPADTTVITLFGSVNDWYWKNGGISIGGVEDTITAGTYAGYVDEAIKTAQRQAPDAKIIIIGTPYFTNQINYQYWLDATAMNKAKAEKYGLPFYDMYTNYYAGKNPENNLECEFSLLFNFSFNTRYKISSGLNFTKWNNSAFKAKYDYPAAPGHPNDLYHSEYIAPLFANILCEC